MQLQNKLWNYLNQELSVIPLESNVREILNIVQAHRDEFDDHCADRPSLSTNPRTRIFLEIVAERQRQEEKHGPQDHDETFWLPILAEEFGEVAKEVCELTQLAAVCVSMLENFEQRYTGVWPGTTKGVAK